MFPPDVPRNVRTLFLSDLHLGFRISTAERCAEVLDYFDAETIYLVGDTIDVARLTRVWFWNDGQQQFVNRVVELHNSGCKVLLLPGNHDPCFLRDENYLSRFANKTSMRIDAVIEPLRRLPMQNSFIHQTATGKKLLVFHGDQVDDVNARFGGIPKLGSKIFDYVSVGLPNTVTLGIRNFFKLVLSRPQKIEDRAIGHAREQQLDGLIMGHLHTPKLKRAADGLMLGNTGDWVENSSLIVETKEGEFLLLNNGKLIDRLA